MALDSVRRHLVGRRRPDLDQAYGPLLGIREGMGDEGVHALAARPALERGLEHRPAPGPATLITVPSEQRQREEASGQAAQLTPPSTSDCVFMGPQLPIVNMCLPATF